MKLLLSIFVTLFALNAFAHGDSDDHTHEEGEGVKYDVGATLPDFTLPDFRGDDITLYEEIKKGPVIVTFYRGGWCPVCNEQLYNLQENIEKIEELGAQLIAISPETPDNAEKTAVKNLIDFKVLSDKGNEVAKEYEILWHMPENTIVPFDKWLELETGKSLEDFNDVEGHYLPIPATFIVNEDAEIIYAYINPDYRMRAPIEDILQTLESDQSE